MEMKKISSGKLRGMGYDARGRVLQVQLADGSMLQYSGVGAEAWRGLSTASSPWSYYRDNIEEEYAAKRVGSAHAESDAAADAPAGNKNPLDDLFRRD
ncbi:MAG TPA: KTSC domain-containing protein [Gallionellaceae bacterium]|nr:KTSC domain-containing protein [Gallionellaceae bacterium]